MSLLPRKRAAATSIDDATTTTTTITNANPLAVSRYDNEEPPSRRARLDVLSCEVETIQAELEHERSLRALDAKRFIQTKQRLEKQVEFALEELKETKNLMEEMREEHERHLEQMKWSRARAQEELRVVQETLEMERANQAADLIEEDPRITRLQADLRAESDENESLKGTIEDLRNELKRFTEKEKPLAKGEQDTIPLGAASEARPEVLKELNRVRIQLAESERKNRQYKRLVEDAQQKSKELIHDKELLRSANKRVEQLELELNKSTRSEESIAAELKNLKDQHATVLDKFAKLKEAVYAEREKAEKATLRADEAEALAGKGSFNPEKTRVLHLSNNPVTVALKEEIEVLRRQVKALSGSKSKAQHASDVDPNKLHQRLKESFKEQISRFREAIFLMTGYKVRFSFAFWCS